MFLGGVNVKKTFIISVSIVSSLLLSACSSLSDSEDTTTTTSPKSPGVQRLDNDNNSNNSNNTVNSNAANSDIDNSEDNSSTDSGSDDSSSNDSGELSDNLSEKDQIKQVFDEWIQFDKEPLTQDEKENEDVQYFIKMNNRAMRNNKTIGNYAKELSRKERTRLWKVPKIIGLYDIVQFNYSNPEQLTIVAHSLAKKDKLYYRTQDSSSTTSPRVTPRDTEEDISIKISGITIDNDTATVSDAGLPMNRDNLKSYIDSFKKKDGKWKVFMNDAYTTIVNKHPVTMGYDPDYESPEIADPKKTVEFYKKMDYDNDH